MPASDRPDRVANWVIGTGSSSRSRTLAPPLTIPETMARLIMRELRAWSRATAMVAPRGRVAAKAAPRRAENSGVSSTLIRPVIPDDEKRPRRHSPAQTTDSLTVEPGSISLWGQIRMPAWMREPWPMTQSSPITAPSSTTVLFLMVTPRPTTAWRSRHPSPM